MYYEIACIWCVSKCKWYIYYVHVCEQARWARSAGNSAIENVCVIIIIIAQRLVHCAVAVSTSVLGQSQRQCPLHCCWATTRSERSPTFAAQLHLPTHDHGSSRSLDLLISPGTLRTKWSLVCIDNRAARAARKTIATIKLALSWTTKWLKFVFPWPIQVSFSQQYLN